MPQAQWSGGLLPAPSFTPSLGYETQNFCIQRRFNEKCESCCIHLHNLYTLIHRRAYMCLASVCSSASPSAVLDKLPQDHLGQHPTSHQTPELKFGTNAHAKKSCKICTGQSHERAWNTSQTASRNSMKPCGQVAGPLDVCESKDCCWSMVACCVNFIWSCEAHDRNLDPF